MSSAPFAPATLALLAALPASAQGSFVDRTADLGIVHEVATGFDKTGSSIVDDWTQRGFAWGDVDGDLDPDLVLCGGLLANTVLRNDGGSFTLDPAAAAQIDVGDYDTSPALADFDRDGDLDLVIGVVESGGSGGGDVGASRLYRNDGSGSFEEVTVLGGTVGRGHSIFAQWADLDADGLLDLLLSEFYTTPNVFYRNNGDGTFTDLSAAVGLDAPGSTHVTAVMDVDDDGRLDVLVGNDYIVSFWTSLPDNEGDLHLHGQADGTWADVSAGSGYDHERGIMGLALGDVNYDGRLDVYKTDVVDNRLMINHGWPTGTAWTEEQDAYGVAADVVPDPFDPPESGRGVGWSAVFASFDHDPWLDLFLVNGQVSGVIPTKSFSPRGQRNFLWTGAGPGSGFAFTDATAALGLYDEIDDRAMAIADPDQDGDLDILIGATTGFVRYFENQLDRAGQGWLAVRPVCNTSAPGGFGVVARYTDSLGYPHVRQIGLDGPTASQHENLAFFGLGTEPDVDLTVTFPSGIELSFPATAPNQVVTAIEPELIRTTARTLPLGSNPIPGGPTRHPAFLPTSELWVVQVFAHDQEGNPLDGWASVQINAPGMVAVTSTMHVAGNEFRRYYRAPAVPGEHRATVTIDGWEVGIRPRVIVYDPLDASGTTARVVPETVRAGSSDTFTVLVAPKAASGVSLGPGDAVDVQVAGLTPVSGPTDLGDGRYAVTFPAPVTPGIYPIDVAHQGARLALGLQVGAAGPVSSTKSTAEVFTPNALNSAAPHQLRVRLVPRDASSRRLGPRAPMEIVAVEDPGSDPVVVRPTHSEGQADGEFGFIVEKPVSDPPAHAFGVLEVRHDGLTIATIPFDF